ncbi:MAG: type IV secretion system protein [Bacteroidota bacterium]|nr:type IV secretion system protein [Bacteroidota bacterium]
MKTLLKPTLLALSLAIAAPNIALAGGIPTADVAMVTTTIAENLKTLEQLKEQLAATQEQIEQAKDFARNEIRRFEGNWNLGNLINNDPFLSSLPREVADSMIGAATNNIDSLRKKYGLSTDNPEVQKHFDGLLKYADRLNSAYKNTIKRISNLKDIKTLLDTADTPAKKADVANKLALEQLSFNQEQQALNRLQEGIKAKQEIDNEIYLKSIKERFNKATDYTK